MKKYLPAWLLNSIQAARFLILLIGALVGVHTNELSHVLR